MTILSLRMLAILLSILIPSAIGKDVFRAAVFEHRARIIESTDPQEIIAPNLRLYEKAAEIASKQGTDLLLFNEYGLFVPVGDRNVMKSLAVQVPDPKSQKYNPCVADDKQKPLLHTLSCLSRKHSMYIVANIADIQPCVAPTCDANGECPDSVNFQCPDDGVRIFNTDVAFNREGTLVGRYHKLHPYLEMANVDPEPQDSAVFETEFGTFGMIVCFDSVFEEATLLDVDTILFPTWWFDDIVPWGAVDWQQSWAIGNNVNFLAANAHVPGMGTIGSGIYSRDAGALVYTYEPDGESKLLIANLGVKSQKNVVADPISIVVTEDTEYPLQETGEKFPVECHEAVIGKAKDKFTDYRCTKYQMEGYSLTKLESTGHGHVETCNNGLCCLLDYSTDNLQEDFYLGAFNGTSDACKFYGFCVEACVVVRCEAFEGQQCVFRPSRSQTVFKNIDLRARFSSKHIYPAVTLDKYRPASKNDWKLHLIGDSARLSFDDKSETPFLRAGLLGRCYERDPPFVAGQMKKGDPRCSSSCPCES